MPRSDAGGSSPARAKWSARSLIRLPALPLSDDLRHRLRVVAIILLGSALLCGEVAHRTPVYRAVAFVDAPLPSSYSDPSALNDGVASSHAAEKLRAEHSSAVQKLLASAIVATGEHANAAPRTEGPFGRARIPRLALRAANRSDILRVVVVAAQPADATRLADAAADLLVLQERRTWWAEIESSAKTGRVSPALTLNGAEIAVVAYARTPARQSPLLRRIGGAACVVTGIVCALCSGLLIADAAALARARGRADLGDLSVPTVAAIRIGSDEVSDSEGEPNTPTRFVVEPAVWRLLDAVSATVKYVAPERAVVVVIGPCGGDDRGGTDGRAHCRNAALYFARTAAARGLRVLLIVATDPLNSVRSAPGVPRLPGFAEAISGHTIAAEWLLEDDDHPNLIALSSGCRDVEPEMVRGEAMRRFLSETASLADWIVVGAGPVGGGREISDLWCESGEWADAAVLVNDTGDPAATDVSRSACALLQIDVPVIGQITWSDDRESQRAK